MQYLLPFADMNIVDFPLLVLKGIYDYWKYCFVVVVVSLQGT